MSPHVGLICWHLLCCVSWQAGEVSMETRDQTGIVWTTLSVLLASYLSCAASAQTLRPRPPDADALHRTFQLRVAQYLTLHRRLESRPRTKLTEPAHMMFLSRV